MKTAGNITLKKFIRLHGITMTAKRTDSNPSIPDSQEMDHWTCSFRICTGQRMRVTFSMGKGHDGKEPTSEAVFDCLASDAYTADMGFADFCANYGYDEDSRSAYRTFLACHRANEKLKKFLADRADAFSQLVYSIERL